LTFVVAEPVFDDFGDVFAALVAHRSLQPREAILDEFSRLEGAGLAVMGSQRAVSIAGFEGQVGEISSSPDSTLLHSADNRFWSRCEPIFGHWRTNAPVAENGFAAGPEAVVRTM